MSHSRTKRKSVGKFRGDTINYLRKDVRHTWHKMDIREGTTEGVYRADARTGGINKWEEKHMRNSYGVFLGFSFGNGSSSICPVQHIKHWHCYTILKRLRCRVSQNHCTGAIQI